MNHIYRLVWSTVANCWVAVAENARGRGKAARRRLVAAALAAGSLAAQAGPTGGQVVAGSGNIAQAGATTTITQASQNLSIDWSSFNIAPQETVNFLQPSAAAIAVNRIFDPNGSQILGHLNANGQVFLINPNGILFGAGAQVDVGGLVASTLDWNGTTTGNMATFSGNGVGSVLNLGTINAVNGGYVALLGNHVGNQGTISAQLGTVALGAGNAVTLTFNGPGLVSVQVTQSLLNALAQNGGLIRADGGQVIMTAGARDALLASVVNNTGTIEARTANSHTGYISLLGGMTAGTVNVGGTLDASAANGGHGGFIETSAAHVKIGDGAIVTTIAANGKSGTWLIDPTNFTISAGSAAQTTSGVGATTLEAALAGGNVSIATSSVANGSDLGDINVNAPVTWSANKLTLTAANDVNINAVMIANNTASLDLEPGSGKVNVGFNSNGGFSGQVNFYQADGVTPRSGTGFLTINGNGYTVITSLGAAGSTSGTDLQGMNGNLSANYALGSNIDATATSGWNAGAGFTPVGNSSTAFSGRFDGLGNTISNLTINRPTGYVGLFGAAGSASVIRNVGLVGGSVSGNSNVGAMAGTNYGAISNSYATGSATGTNNFIGGLVGLNQTSGTVNNSYATDSVSGPYNVGGLVGYNHGGTISNSYATGAVTGTLNDAGGLVGAGSGTISNSYAKGSVSGNANVGGLMGHNYGTVSVSYATGNVSGSNYVGGLMGHNYGTVTNSYATGSVSAPYNVGGLVGSNYGAISNSYATGIVTGTQSDAGGLVGANYGTISNSYATGSVSGNTSVGGLVGYNSGNTVSNSYATGNVTGSNYVGGLVGNNLGTVISNSYAKGSATGTNNVGGLVGFNSSASGISNSYAAGNVNGSSGVAVGGLVGENNGTVTNSYYTTGTVSGTDNTMGGLVGANYGAISNSYSTGNVNGNQFTGGLVGGNSSSGSITNSYATGSVSGSSYVGGLAGSNYGRINNSYANGNAKANQYVGGLLGQNGASVNNSFSSGSVSVTGSVTVSGSGGLIGLARSGATTTNSFWDATTSGQSTSAGGTGMSTAQMQTQANFTSATVPNGNANPAWDFSNTWVMYNGYTYPLLRSFMTNLTVSTITATKTYDGTAYADANGVTYSITPNGNLLGTSGLTFTDNLLPVVNAGTYANVLPGGLYSNQQGYIITYAPGTVTVNKANLSVSGESANNKVYDTTNTATLKGGSLVGAVAGDAVTLNQAGTFGSVNVGNGIAVTASDSLSGAAAGNYTLTQPSGLAANITPASLVVTGISASNKVYDTTATASLSGTPTVTALGSDVVTVGGTGAGAFADPNVGNAKPVTVSGFVLGGAGAGNYSIVQPVGVTANITPASLTVAGESAASKVYDATSTATLSGGTLVGILGGDAVTLTQAGTFATKNVGTGIAVAASDSLSGAAAGNYTLTQPTGLSANITPASVTLNGMSATSKTYDGTTAAALVGTPTVVALGSDVLTISGAGSGAFADPNVGNNKPVTVSGYTLGGSSAGNYTLTQAAGITGNITPASLSVAGETAVNKVYDSSTAAVLVGGTLVGLIGGDAVTLNQSGTFATKNVGTGIAVNAADTLGGSAAGNYTLVQPTGLSANITPASLTVTGESAANKVYDNTTGAAVSSGKLVGVYSGDSVTLTEGGAFASKNVGTGIAVNTTDAIGGSAASNYVLVQPGGINANITPATLTVSGESAANKTYDGTTGATLSGGTLLGVIGGDSVTLTQAGNFVSKNAGTGVAVTAADTLGGTAAGNYVLTQPTGLAATITPATLTYTATPATLTSGQQVAGLTGSVAGFVAGDSLAGSTSGTATWTTTAGTGSAAGVYAIDGSGLLSSNYVFAQAGSNATALTLKAGTASKSVQTVTTALDASLPSSQTSTQLATQNIAPTTVVTQGLGPDPAFTGDSSLSTPADAGAPSDSNKAGSIDPVLRIVSSGIKLPYDSLNLNE